MGRRNDQNFTDPSQHQRGQRIVDHRLVVDRQQLLGSNQGHWVKARAATAGEDNALQNMPQSSDEGDGLNNRLMNSLTVEGEGRKRLPAFRSTGRNWPASLPAWDSRKWRSGQ